MRQIVHFILEFCCLFLLTTADMTKPGKCIPWLGGAGPCSAGCQNDWTCSGTQKCCLVGCSRMCLDPCPEKCDGIGCSTDRTCSIVDGCVQCVLKSGKNEKPGKCFSFSVASNNPGSSCIDHCTDDFNCTGSMKCCQTSCGKICVSMCSRTCDPPCGSGTECKVLDSCAQCIPISTAGSAAGTATTVSETAASDSSSKPGKCSKWQGGGPCIKNCEKDSECPGSRKCCSVGCGKLCEDPCPTKCGELPPCLSGNECQMVDGCAECVPTSGGKNEKPVVTLATAAATTTTVIVTRKKQVGVATGSATTVVEPAPIDSSSKPGKCSKWQGGSGPCVKNCEKDSECPGSRKCCSVGCGKLCEDPCPKKCNELPPCISGNECQVVDGCAECVPTSGGTNEKPVVNSAATTTTTIVPVTTKNPDPTAKPGRCVKWQGSGPCLKNCEKDPDCPGNRKCCTIGTCGKICQDPCPTVCDFICTSGKECKVVDGCAQCVDVTSST